MSELLERLEREVLPLVARPSRYTGGERNVPEKDPEDADLSFLLAFPDVYEIGMSHLGIRMLYDILNRRPDVIAERTFAPWTDMEEPDAGARASRSSPSRTTAPRASSTSSASHSSTSSTTRTSS